jgi:hypothetical protein
MRTPLESAYAAFNTNEPIKKVAARLGVGFRTVRVWWIQRYGEKSVASRTARVKAAAATRTGISRRITPVFGEKACTKCGASKKLKEYPKKSSGSGRSSWCLVCCRTYRKEQGYKRAALSERRRWIDSLKDRPCADCQQTFPPVVMDFDHVRGDKVASISLMLGWRKDRILAEVAKCDVVCANCHRIRTHLHRKVA